MSGFSLSRNCNTQPTSPNNPTIFLNRAEAARFLRIKPGTLANLHLRGQGPVFFKKGKLVYYRTEDLVAWIEAGRQEVK